MKERTYVCCDLKSFYASVECVERGLDPMTTNLVVADKRRTEKTICLAVTPSLKAYGISGRARLFEVVQRVAEVNAQRRWNAPGHQFSGSSWNDPEVRRDPSLELDYIVAPPRMAHYIDWSTRIYQVYLKYIAPEDIYPYSIDEVFMDINHVLMLRATEEDGSVIPEFEKVLDIDIKAAAEAALGKELTQNLLSVVFDYDGNLWFATGGFRIYPERQQQGVLGYIARPAIDAILRGEQTDLSKAVFVYELTPGEGAENGIAASRDGAVILTNMNCYLLRADNGVDVAWCTPYESVGAKVSGEGDKTTGGGLAWGGGCSPTLTPNLVMFTDNADPVKLLALDMKTGEVVASMPVLDDLPEGYQVAVENSAIVYDDGEGTVSTIVCNWFGAGNAGLADPNSDSSIQSYANIYDQNWLMKGNVMIAPGIERVDTVKTDSGYEMKSIWSRNDLSDTSILKLSTATGYIYGYVQDLTTGMWQYIILDFETGETVFTMDVSNRFGYNNMAIGMYAGNSGNALYCPTGYMELLRLQDRFVYLPEMPYREVDLDKAARNILSQEQFELDGGEGTVASWRSTVTIRNVHPNTTVAFRMNNLSGSASDLMLYAYGMDGKLAKVASELWSITDEAGEAVTELTDGTLYEVRITVADGGELDLSDVEKEIKFSCVLGE